MNKSRPRYQALHHSAQILVYGSAALDKHTSSQQQIRVCVNPTMANVHQVRYTRIHNEDEGNEEETRETTASGQRATASPAQQQAATVPQPVMVPQQPFVTAVPPPVGGMPQGGAVQYMPQGGAVQYTPQVGAVQYTPQVGAVQYIPQAGTVQNIPQAGAVQFIPQPVQPLTQVRIHRRDKQGCCHILIA